MPHKNMTTSQPVGWEVAFKKQSERNGQKLSEYVGECCTQGLEDDLLIDLPKRPPLGRPKKS